MHDPGGRPSVTEFQQWLGGDTFVMSVRCGTTPVVQGEDVTDDGEFCEG